MPRIFNSATGKFEDLAARKAKTPGVPINLIEAAVVLKGDKGDAPTPEEVRPIIREEVRPIIKEEVASAVAKIHPPEEVRPIIKEEVASAVAKIRTPEDGKSVDPADVKKMVAAAVSKFEPARDGRQIELRAAAGVIEWRYEGDANWQHLMRVPKARAGGGGAHYLRDLGDVNPDRTGATEGDILVRRGGKFVAEAPDGFGYLGAPQNLALDSGNHTLALEDSGKSIDKTVNTARVLTIPANTSIAFPIGTVIIGSNLGTGAVTIAITDDTLYYGTATGSRAVQQGGTWGLRKITSTAWMLTGTAIT